MSNYIGPLSRHLEHIEAECKKGPLSLQKILNLLGEDSHYVLILFLILPFLQPIPMLGLSTPLGIIIAIIALFAYFKKPACIPKRWADREISSESVLKIVNGSDKILKKLSVIIHPRWSTLLKSPFRDLSIFLLIINAILLALPLPIPFSNTLPAWAIFFIALAHLEEDGLFVLLAYTESIITGIYFTLLFLGAKTGISFLDKY